MAVIGTFGTFTTARLGIYASQASLQVTGNNIANINTKGYTRQRADLYSLNSTGTAKYANPYGVDIGYGVLVKSTTQLRDPYLDIRYRNENTKLGASNATLNGLLNISQTLDEVNKGGESKNGLIEDYLMNFKSMLNHLHVNVGSEEADGLVREVAKGLTTFFNNASKELQTTWELQKDELEDTVKSVNECLVNIRNLNEQIRKQGIYGDLALELRDHRNLEIDKLSQYVGIDVEYSLERIDQYTSVEKLTIYLKDTRDPRTADPNNPYPSKIKLVDGLYAAQLSFSTEEANPKYQAEQKQEPQPAVDQNGNIIQGQYVKENGDITTNPAEANMVLLNPDWNEALEKLRAPAPNSGVLLNPKYDADKVIDATLPDGTTIQVVKNTDAATAADGKYLKPDNTPTNDPAEAALAQLQYMAADGNPYGTMDPANAKKAPDKYLTGAVDANGNPITTNDPTQAGDASRKYLTDPQYAGTLGATTNDPEKAAKTDPNKFLLDVERLEDKFGRPLDKGKKTESVTVPLDDTALTGALQSMRELLTEEGEFASKLDAGILTDDTAIRHYLEAQVDDKGVRIYNDAAIDAIINPEILANPNNPGDPVANAAVSAAKAQKEQVKTLLERASDKDANIKMGIPYYQKRLDLLAQKFAKMFNDANQLPASTVYESGAEAGDATQFMKTGTTGKLDVPVTYTDSDGNKQNVTWGLVTVEVAVLDKDGNVTRDDQDQIVTERVPYDASTARAQYKALVKAEAEEAAKQDPTVHVPTEKELEEAADKKFSTENMKLAETCLEALRSNGQLTEEYEYYDGGVLFSNNGNNNDPTGITAGNITISNSWAARTVRVLNSKIPNTGGLDHSSDNTNIDHMLSIFDSKLDYRATEVEPDAAKGDQIFYQGSFLEMYTNMGATLGSETSTMDSVAYNYELLTLNIDNNRLSVSGVDLNDEATSMMQFQKSYQAACRLLTTIDSMLDTLINGTLR